MTQYNTLNVKLSNSQLNKLKSAIKKGTEATLNLSSNLIGNWMIKLIFHINCYYLIHKFQRFVKLLQMVYQLISNFKKLNYLR